ncbi:ATP-grasp domain-containing protein [Candidatus Saccharibacteria bacterium]|nr:ATP-grasp domain-containing protein [Candidatus Saccharibacteria bacterium]
MTEVHKLAIIGDGQLGRMTAEVAIPMGHEVYALGSAGERSPAAMVGAQQVEGYVMNAADIRRFAEIVGKEGSVFTLDLEQVNADALAGLKAEGYRVEPSPTQLKVIQDKWEMKQQLRAAGVPVVPFMRLDNPGDYRAARNQFGAELMVKARFGSFDGRGNLHASTRDNWDDIVRHFTDKKTGELAGLYVEQFTPFDRELAVVGARGVDNQVGLYQPFETKHRLSICHTVTTPANINADISDQAINRFHEVLRLNRGLGVLAVEMFEYNGEIYVNEYARRVHNSGHVTQDAHETSQFKLHLQAILGLELGSTERKARAAAMINILGTYDNSLTEAMLSAQDYGDGNAWLHLYDKAPRAGEPRKIGHVNAIGNNVAEALASAQAIHDVFGDPYAVAA